MEDGSGQGSVRSATLEDLYEGASVPPAAGRDYRDRYSFGDSARQLAIKARASSITIHGRQQNLSRPALRRLSRPGHGIAMRFASMATITACEP